MAGEEKEQLRAETHSSSRTGQRWLKAAVSAPAKNSILLSVLQL